MNAATTLVPLGRHQELFATHVSWLLPKAFELGFDVRLGEVQRPLEMQELYVRTGRSKTMNSMHIKKLAIDLNLLVKGKIATREQVKPLGVWWESLAIENRWGGSWRGFIDLGTSSFVDIPHFERLVL